MSRPATTAEWNADRAASEKEFSPVKLPRFNALRKEAKILVDRKRFMRKGSPMNKTYIGSDGSQIIVANGIVTETASPEHCPVGKKPNMDFIRRCGFRARKAVKQYFVGPLSDGKGNRING